MHLVCEVHFEFEVTTVDFILSSKKVNWYRNDKLMHKVSLNEYSWLKAIEDVSKNVCTKLV